MKSKPVVAIVLGLILLVVGGLMQLNGTAPRSDAEAVARCQAEMARRGAGTEMTSRCDEATFATMVTATDASQAAQAISAANNSEIGGNALSMFCLGLGFVLALGGVLLLRKRPPLP